MASMEHDRPLKRVLYDVKLLLVLRIYNLDSQTAFYAYIFINVYGPGSNKRDLRGIKVKIKVGRQKETSGFDEHFLKI